MWSSIFLSVMMRTVSLIFFLIEFRKYETLELLNHFTKINPPCQMKNSVFTTLSGCSRVRCGGLCDSNSFGRCGRFIWDQDSRTCMLHSSTIFPGTSPYTVTTGGGRSTYSKTRKGNCGLRFNDQDLFLLFRLFWILLRLGVLDTPLCDKVCQWLATGHWFSQGTPVSSTNKTNRYDITEILLKMALSSITVTVG